MTRQIELCMNSEWVVNNLMSELGLEVDNKDDLANEWYSLVERAIENEFADVECIQAVGQRTLYHGWNGANTFLRKESGLGTFDNFEDVEWSKLVDMADAIASKLAAGSLKRLPLLSHAWPPPSPSSGTKPFPAPLTRETRK